LIANGKSHSQISSVQIYAQIKFIISTFFKTIIHFGQTAHAIGYNNGYHEHIAKLVATFKASLHKQITKTGRHFCTQRAELDKAYRKHVKRPARLYVLLVSSDHEKKCTDAMYSEKKRKITIHDNNNGIHSISNNYRKLDSMAASSAGHLRRGATLTFDLLTSKPNQFIFVSRCSND